MYWPVRQDVVGIREPQLLSMAKWQMYAEAYNTPALRLLSTTVVRVSLSSSQDIVETSGGEYNGSIKHFQS